MRRLLPIVLMLAAAAGLRAETNSEVLPPEMGDAPLAPELLPPLPRPEARPLERLEVRFSGVSAFPEEDLEEAIARQLTAIQEYGLTEATAYDAAFYLEVFYRKQGFPMVRAEPRLEGASTILLQVTEGPRTMIGEIELRGISAFDRETLIPYLLSPTRQRFQETDDDERLPFVEADLKQGVEFISRLYAAQGYLNAEITGPQIAFTADRALARVKVVVREGRQHHFGHITFSGEPGRSPEELMGAVAEIVREPYTDNRLDAARRRLEDFYRMRGHYTVRVEAEGNPAAAPAGRVPVTFRIDPGPVYLFNGVRVQGNRDLPESFLERRLEPLAGHPYNPDLLDKKYRELIQTGLFRDLRIHPVPLEDGRLLLDVQVEEAKPKEFSIGLGYGSFEGPIFSLSYSDLNFHPAGRPISLTAELTGRGYAGEVRYTDPWLFDTDYSLSLRLYALNREFESYKKFEYGFRPTISRKITDHWEVSAFLQAKHVYLDEINVEPVELAGPENYTVISAGISQTLDFRNDPVNPTRGYIFTTVLDGGFLQLGSDISYIRGTYRYSHYFPVTRRSVLAVGMSGGIVSPGGGLESLPIDERFFNGGATTVRSFEERDLGPKSENGLPIGGYAYTVFNVEYSFPIRGDLRGAVFADAGNVVSGAGRFSFDEMRYGVGVGLRYNLPVGPIRVDLGINPSPKRGENSGALHFSVGLAF